MPFPASLVAVMIFALLGGIARPAWADTGKNLFGNPGASPQGTPLDHIVRENLQSHGLKSSPPCSDAVFLRRVYLDVAGKLPQPSEVRAFLADPSPDKRQATIDRLLSEEDFAALSAMRWSDTLRVKSEFPINLWPNAAQAYHRWILVAMRRNMPYDLFTTTLITASGSNFRNPPANFLRAVSDKTPRGVAAAVMLTFFGQRWESVDPPCRAQVEAAFSGLAFKPTAEWKEEIVYYRPVDTKSMALPGGHSAGESPTGDPRPALARWVTSRNNAAFAEAAANRVWAWLFGRGIVHEPDDFRSDNPPAVPGLLEYLGREFIASGYDLRALHRLILNSATYQQSCVPGPDSSEAARFFACYPVHPLEAEVLIDAIDQVTGTGEDYKSVIPEPFTFVPTSNRTIELPDGSISSAFLDLFGRSPRDTGFFSERTADPTEEQRRHLLNSRHIQSKISKGPLIRSLAQKKRPAHAIEQIYLTILSRPPDDRENKIAGEYFSSSKKQLAAAEDLAWALINSKEFLFHH